MVVKLVPFPDSDAVPKFVPSQRIATQFPLVELPHVRARAQLPAQVPTCPVPARMPSSCPVDCSAQLLVPSA